MIRILCLVECNREDEIWKTDGCLIIFFWRLGGREFHAMIATCLLFYVFHHVPGFTASITQSDCWRQLCMQWAAEADFSSGQKRGLLGEECQEESL